MTEGIQPSGRRMVRGTLLNILQFVLTGALLPLILTPVIFDRLDVVGFARWALLFTIGSWFLFLDMGIHLGVARFAGNFAGAGDGARLRRLFVTLLAVYLALAGISIAAAAGLSHPLLQAFVGDHAHPSDDYALVMIIVFHILSALIRAASGFLNGMQDIQGPALITIIMGLMQAVGVWVWARHPGSNPLDGLAAVYLGTVAGQSLLLIRQIRRTRIGPDGSKLSVDFRNVDVPLLRNILAFSLVMYVTHLLMNVLVSDRLYLGWIRAPLEQIAEYHLGALLVSKTSSFLSVFAVAIYPAVAALDALQDRRRIESLTIRAFRIYAATGVFLFLFLCVNVDRILYVWMGREIPFAARVTWMLAGWGLTGILGGLGAVAAGVGRPDIQLKSALAALGTMVLLYPCLIRPLGATGMAIAITLSFLLSAVVYMVLFRRCVFPLAWSTVFVDGILKPSVCAAVSVLPVAYLLSYAMSPTRWVGAAMLAAGFALSSVVQLVLCRFAGLVRREDWSLIRAGE